MWTYEIHTVLLTDRSFRIYNLSYVPCIYLIIFFTFKATIGENWQSHFHVASETAFAKGCLWNLLLWWRCAVKIYYESALLHKSYIFIVGFNIIPVFFMWLSFTVFQSFWMAYTAVCVSWCLLRRRKQAQSLCFWVRSRRKILWVSGYYERFSDCGPQLFRK